MGADTKGKLILRKIHVFVLEKCFEDVRQDEKHVPDLLESIIQPKLFVKEELRFKIDRFRPEITKIRFDPRVKSSKMGLSMDPRHFSKRPTLSCGIWPS